jgi:hypothetical protein
MALKFLFKKGWHPAKMQVRCGLYTEFPASPCIAPLALGPALLLLNLAHCSFLSLCICWAAPLLSYPAPVQNEERVWIAEQKVESEKKRIEEFKKQMEQERQVDEMRRLQESVGARKRVDRVEWMYNAPMAAEPQQLSAEDIFAGRVTSREEEEKIKKVRMVFWGVPGVQQASSVLLSQIIYCCHREQHNDEH